MPAALIKQRSHINDVTRQSERPCIEEGQCVTCPACIMQTAMFSATHWVQIAGLQIVVDQEAVTRALPLVSGTRMTLPLMLHAPQVAPTCTAHLVQLYQTAFCLLRMPTNVYMPLCLQLLTLNLRALSL